MGLIIFFFFFFFLLFLIGLDFFFFFFNFFFLIGFLPFRACLKVDRCGYLIFFFLTDRKLTASDSVDYWDLKMQGVGDKDGEENGDDYGDMDAQSEGYD